MCTVHTKRPSPRSKRRFSSLDHTFIPPSNKTLISRHEKGQVISFEKRLFEGRWGRTKSGRALEMAAIPYIPSLREVTHGAWVHSCLRQAPSQIQGNISYFCRRSLKLSFVSLVGYETQTIVTIAGEEAVRSSCLRRQKNSRQGRLELKKKKGRRL
jgi:hypothetical protein